MANESSLFLKVKIQKKNLDEFLSLAPQTPIADDNWQQWWDSREMYGKTDLSDSLYAYRDKTNNDIVDWWVNNEHAIGFSEYDEAIKIWHLGFIIFSENYDEMLPFFAFIKHLAKYVDDSLENFVLVYDYFWDGDSVVAFMEFKDGKALFYTEISEKSEVDPEKLSYADYYLALKWSEYEKTVNWDE